MNSLIRERYEVALAAQEEVIYLEVLFHQRRILLVNVVIDGTTQAVYYPSPEIDMPPSEAERACRMAIMHFRTQLYRVYGQDRRSVLRRKALILNPLGPLYDGVLLKHLDGAASPLTAKATLRTTA